MREDWYLDAGAWRRHLVDEVLQHWLARAVDRQHGGYVCEFDRRWGLVGAGLKTLVSQSRLVYNFCVGFRRTGRAEFRDAAEHGVTFLREHFADRVHGGWIWQCRRDGSVDDDAKVTYGHAFVIFALAEYAHTFDRSDAADTARRTVEDLQQHMRDGAVWGFWTRATRDWRPETQRRSQNPHMHLLEALLSLYRATEDERVLGLAEGICRFARDSFVHPEHGCLEELFASDWSRLADNQAAPVEAGHQFEWAWLLNRAADLGADPSFRGLAEKLLGWGVRYGWDNQRGGVFNQCDRHGRPLQTDKTYWVQSEALRAMFYVARGGGQLDARVLQTTADFVWQYCADHEHGGWFATVDRRGSPVNADKGGLWKLDYHVVSLCDEAIRLLEDEPG